MINGDEKIMAYTEPVLEPEKRIGKLRFIVEGGLHYIRGNHAPHFTITVSGKDGGSEFGGADHEFILKYYPKYQDLVDLHLSDIDGVPTHAVENGYYWLSACQGKNQWEQNPAKDYREIFRNYVRIPDKEAWELVNTIRTKEEFSVWVETQKPRWKKEAEDCIKHHKLVVFGDNWHPEVI